MSDTLFPDPSISAAAEMVAEQRVTDAAQARTAVAAAPPLPPLLEPFSGPGPPGVKTPNYIVQTAPLPLTPRFRLVLSLPPRLLIRLRAMMELAKLPSFSPFGIAGERGERGRRTSVRNLPPTVLRLKAVPPPAQPASPPLSFGHSGDWAVVTPAVSLSLSAHPSRVSRAKEFI